MVKIVSALLLVVAFVTPALAQDVPPIELGFGYGNLALKSLTPGRHSGFATHQVFNLNSVLAIENYLGYYGFGRDPSLGKIEMISDTFGGKFSFRRLGPVFYGSAGIGGGWLRFPDLGAGTNSAFAIKLGGGVDVPINDTFAWKVDVSRMSIHFFEQWHSGVNISTGIVFKIHGGF